MRLSGTKVGAVHQYRGFGDVLYDKGAARPTLDLNFANNDSLADSITGKTLPTFTRASSGTYVDGDGVIQSAAVDTPRFDHDPATGESLGLLIEEARTNLVPSSNGFDSFNVSNVSKQSGHTGPDGSQDAYKLTSTTSTDKSRVFILRSSTAGTVVTFSVYLKIDSGSLSQQACIALGSQTIYAQKNITLTTDWQRFDITATVPSDGIENANPVVYLNPDADTGDAVTGDYLYVFGFQLEAGSFPTSYIPTEGTTVTRAADVAEITGANFAKTNLLQYSERFDQSVWTKGPGVTVEPNTAISPDGTMTADTVKFTGIDQYIENVITGTTGVNYVSSVYVKGTAGETIRFSAAGISATNHTLTGGWDRVYLSGTLSGTNASVNVNTFAGVTARTVYIWGAQLEEGSVLTDYTPSVESFDSRASSATYVDDTTGLIKTTPVNLVLYSEEIDRSVWVKSNAAVTTNSTESPDGSLSADLVRDNINTAEHYVLQNISLTAGTFYTATIYAKQNGRSFLRIAFGSAAGNPLAERVAWFNISNGTLATLPSGSGVSSIEDAGNGWYRCRFTFTPSNTATVPFVPTVSDQDYGSSAPSYAGDGTSGIYLWGAQVQEGSTATPYIRTTSTISGAARYENGELLLEEARTNLLTYSEDIAQGQVGTNVSKSGNTTTSPDGTNTADSLTENTASGAHGMSPLNMSFTSGVTYTFSYYFKATGAGSVRYPQLAFANSSHGSAAWATFDLVNQVVDAQGGSVTSASVEDAGSGWYRCSVTATATGTTTTGGFISISDISTGTRAQSYTGDGVSGIHLWGGQIEAGSYPTSYIPTSGTTVTRAADVSTSALGVDSFYNQSEGTVFVELGSEQGDIPSRFQFSDDSLTNRLQSRKNQLYCFNGTQQFYLLYTSSLKEASAFSGTSTSVAVSGSVVATHGSASLPTCTNLELGKRGGTFNYLNGHIKRLAYFNTRLPDATLQNITS